MQNASMVKPRSYVGQMCPFVIHPQCAGNENIRSLACLIAMLLIVRIIDEHFDL